MGIRTGKPRGRPPNGSNTLPPLPQDAPLPGSKEGGERFRLQMAAYLEHGMPAKERAKRIIALSRQEDASPGMGNPQAVLAALKYMNELSGVVTQEKGAEETAPLPQIVVFGEPEARPTSVDALKLLATAKGSQYDERFPSSPPDPPKPPQPFKSEITVHES